MDFESPIPVFKREAPQKTWSPPGQEDPEDKDKNSSEEAREARERSEARRNSLEVPQINAQFFERIERIGTKILEIGTLNKTTPPQDYAIHQVYELMKYGDMLSNFCSLYIRMEAANKQ